MPSLKAYISTAISPTLWWRLSYPCLALIPETRIETSSWDTIVLLQVALHLVQSLHACSDLCISCLHWLAHSLIPAGEWRRSHVWRTCTWRVVSWCWKASSERSLSPRFFRKCCWEMNFSSQGSMPSWRHASTERGLVGSKPCVAFGSAKAYIRLLPIDISSAMLQNASGLLASLWVRNAMDPVLIVCQERSS